MNLVKRGNIWWVSATLTLPDGTKRKVRRTTGVPVVGGSKALAEKRGEEVVASERAAAEGGERSADGRRRTLGDLARLYVGRPGGVSAGTRRIVDLFVDRFGDVSVDRLDSADIMIWHHRGERKAGTVAREMAVTIALLRYAEDFGIALPPWRLKKPSVSDARDRWLSEGERDALLGSFTHETARRVATFLFYTGARLGEALTLTWDWVRVDPKTGEPVAVVFRSRKGRGSVERKRVVPLTEEARWAVVGSCGTTFDRVGRVFLNSHGTAWTGDRFRARWNRACEIAGIEDFRPHDARHTFASLLVQRGVSLQVVGQLLGHTSGQMTQRYAHLAPSQFSDAVAVLSGAGEKKGDAVVTSPSQLQHRKIAPSKREQVVPPPRFELGTSRLPSGRSTPELRRPNASLPGSKLSVEAKNSSLFKGLTKASKGVLATPNGGLRLVVDNADEEES